MDSYKCYNEHFKYRIIYDVRIIPEHKIYINKLFLLFYFVGFELHETNVYI